jgi:hypothetical protein
MSNNTNSISFDTAQHISVLAGIYLLQKTKNLRAAESYRGGTFGAVDAGSTPAELSYGKNLGKLQIKRTD